MSPIRVLIVDDQRLVRKGLRMQLGVVDDIEVVGEAADGVEAIAVATQTKPHVVLMDIQMPNLNGIAATKRLHIEMPDVRVILLTTFDDDEYIFDGLRAGAVSYLLKDAEDADILKAIRAALHGDAVMHPSVTAKVITEFARLAPRPPAVPLVAVLSVRERDVLALVAQGYSNQDIADKLGLSAGTVGNQLTTILEKLKVENRVQAAVRATELGIV
jgi:DNA-binding NarL/FixJ family response regulator